VKQANFPLLNEVGRATLRRISFLCVIILISLFGMENLVEEPEEEEERFGFKKWLLIDLGWRWGAKELEGILDLEHEMVSLGIGRSPLHAPLLLGWACVVRKAAELSPSVPRSPPVSCSGCIELLT
jgi:hypothetical protein